MTSFLAKIPWPSFSFILILWRASFTLATFSKLFFGSFFLSTSLQYWTVVFLIASLSTIRAPVYGSLNAVALDKFLSSPLMILEIWKILPALFWPVSLTLLISSSSLLVWYSSNYLAFSFGLFLIIQSIVFLFTALVEFWWIIWWNLPNTSNFTYVSMLINIRYYQ